MCTNIYQLTERGFYALKYLQTHYLLYHNSIFSPLAQDSFYFVKSANPSQGVSVSSILIDKYTPFTTHLDSNSNLATHTKPSRNFPRSHIYHHHILIVVKCFYYIVSQMKATSPDSVIVIISQCFPQLTCQQILRVSVFSMETYVVYVKPRGRQPY